MKLASRLGWVGLVAVLALGAAPAALAGTIDPGTYQLLDHELDGAFVELIWDGGNTATISGDINENTAVAMVAMACSGRSTTC